MPEKSQTITTQAEPDEERGMTLDELPVEVRLRVIHAGRWVAWAEDDQSVVAVADTYEEVREAKIRAGFPRAVSEWLEPVPIRPSSPMIRFRYKPLAVRGTRMAGYETVYRPLIPIYVFGPGQDDLRMLVDTGADDTLLLGETLVGVLGVILRPGDHAVVFGIEGVLTVVRYGTVDLLIPGAGGGYRWSARVGFHAGYPGRPGTHRLPRIFHRQLQWPESSPDSHAQRHRPGPEPFPPP